MDRRPPRASPRSRQLIPDYRALRANGIGGAGALAWKNLSKLGQFVARPDLAQRR